MLFSLITAKFSRSNLPFIYFSFNHNLPLLSTITTMPLLLYVSLIMKNYYILAKEKNYFFWFYAFSLFSLIHLSSFNLSFPTSILLLFIIIISSFSFLYFSSPLITAAYFLRLILEPINVSDINVSILFNLFLANVILL